MWDHMLWKILILWVGNEWLFYWKHCRRPHRNGHHEYRTPSVSVTPLSAIKEKCHRPMKTALAHIFPRHQVGWLRWMEMSVFPRRRQPTVFLRAAECWESWQAHGRQLGSVVINTHGLLSQFLWHLCGWGVFAVVIMTVGLFGDLIFL